MVGSLPPTPSQSGGGGAGEGGSGAPGVGRGVGRVGGEIGNLSIFHLVFCSESKAALKKNKVSLRRPKETKRSLEIKNEDRKIHWKS